MSFQGFSRLIFLSLLITACSSKPVLYPNQKYKDVGQTQASSDIEWCMQEAEKFVDSPKGKKMLKSTGAGAMIGGAVGAVSGIFTGDITGGMAQGAAMGGAGGAVAGALSPDELRQQYTNQCLAEKEYQVLGWD